VTIRGTVFAKYPRKAIQETQRMPLPTAFAPAERLNPGELEEQQELVEGAIGDRRCLDAVPEPLVVLNAQRQVTYANAAFLRSIGKKTTADVLGVRPGEALNCTHAGGTGGCGTTAFCRTCGAVTAILESQQGQQSQHECRILTDGDGSALDLQVMASPFDVKGERYTLFTVQDISDQKRRRALERIFFHDILNAAGGLQGLAQLEIDGDNDNEFVEIVHRIASQLVSEIRAQRELSAAESNELIPSLSPLRSKGVLEDVVSMYAHHEVARGKNLVFGVAHDAPFISDAGLLRRVLGNMVKNALEASGAGDSVTVTCEANHELIYFAVHNPAVMTPDVRLQIFQRSFSTKGKDRGLGTYSIKLLTECYLGGYVTCESNPQDGTMFRIALPLGM
jgi:signal transduction histidine kinase